MKSVARRSAALRLVARTRRSLQPETQGLFALLVFEVDNFQYVVEAAEL